MGSTSAWPTVWFRTLRAWPPLNILIAAVAVLVGLVVGQGAWSAHLTDAGWYLPAAGLLLAIGLYGSTHEIDRAAVRRDLRTVAVVVTFGVLLKAVFIAGVMLLLFRQPHYLVLGIAVAQIDPLSVAAMSGNTHMSQRAKSLLAVWAAFDDPMTVLLSVYFPVAAHYLAGTADSSAVAAGDGGWAYARSAGYNALLCLAAVATWYVVRRWWPARRTRRAGDGSAADTGALVVVGAVIIAAAARMLMLGVAVTGLLVRTGRHRHRVNTAVTVAFVLAAGGLGVLLVRDVSPGTGIVLGVAAFAAQAVVALLVLPLTVSELSRTDRISLALSQQNGITAIILALALEPAFPGTVGIVGPAVLTVGVLYYVTNALWTRRLRAAGAPPAPQDGHPAADPVVPEQRSETVTTRDDTG